MKYCLRERRLDTVVFDLVDRESDVVIGVASSDVVETAKRESIRTARVGSLTGRLLGIFAPIFFLFWLAGLILGMRPSVPPRNSRPRLILRRPNGEIVLTLRVSSGLLYDSRRVYDGQGRLIAHLRSGAKSGVGGGFEIIDLRGCEDDNRDIGCRPQLGRVECSGSAYRLRLVSNPDTGRITPQTASPDNDPPETLVRDDIDHYDIDASPSLRHDATNEILLLAAALTVAWSRLYATSSMGSG